MGVDCGVRLRGRSSFGGKHWGIPLQPMGTLRRSYSAVRGGDAAVPKLLRGFLVLIYGEFFLPPLPRRTKFLRRHSVYILSSATVMFDAGRR